MVPSILILGAGGQLGTALRGLVPGAAVCTRTEVDFARPETIAPALRRVQPEIVLNCVAYNAVDQAEKEVGLAFTINAFAVRELALICRALGATLVHFSTNYVFGQDQDRRIPYTEEDVPGPVSAYAASKLAGEHFVRSLAPRHLVIRTTGLFGRRAPERGPANFVEKILDRAKKGEKLRVVNDQVCTPTAAPDLAQATLNLLSAGATGLYHFTSAGQCTWHEFATAAVRLAGLPNQVEPVTSKELNTPAQRPAYSVLSCERYDGHGFAARDDWRQALERYVRGK